MVLGAILSDDDLSRKKMDPTIHFKSLALELNALKDRVRNFIDDAHWLTDGEWKEAVLRAMLRLGQKGTPLR